MVEREASRPTIEFVVPFYGDAEYLRDAVTSVLVQTDGQWRLTVVEDGDQGSGVGKWLQGLGDSRVRHLCNERTLGLAANFQRCLDQASDDYVTFMGCDDRLRPTYVETIRRGLLRRPTASMVQPGVQVIDQGGLPASPLADRLKARLAPRAADDVVLSGEPLLASLMRGNWTYFPSIAWRSERLKRVGFRRDLHVAVDLVALASLVLDGASMLLMPDVVFEYRRHLSSASSLAATNSSRFLEERRVMRELAGHAKGRGWQRASRAARFRTTSRAHAAALLPGAIRTGNWDTAREYVRHILGP